MTARSSTAGSQHASDRASCSGDQRTCATMSPAPDAQSIASLFLCETTERALRDGIEAPSLAPLSVQHHVQPERDSAPHQHRRDVRSEDAALDRAPQLLRAHVGDTKYIDHVASVRGLEAGGQVARLSLSVRTARALARTLASARLKIAVDRSGLSQQNLGALVGVDARQVRRWLSGAVSLGPLELLAVIESSKQKPLVSALTEDRVTRGKPHELPGYVSRTAPSCRNVAAPGRAEGSALAHPDPLQGRAARLARRVHTAKVAGSNPASATKRKAA